MTTKTIDPNTTNFVRTITTNDPETTNRYRRIFVETSKTFGIDYDEFDFEVVVSIARFVTKRYVRPIDDVTYDDRTTIERSIRTYVENRRSYRRGDTSYVDTIIDDVIDIVRSYVDRPSFRSFVGAYESREN